MLPVATPELARHRHAFTTAAALVSASLLGVIDAYLYLGRGAGFWVSNMSALWLFLPFMVAAMAARTRRGAVVLGYAVTLAAFLGFYAAAIAKSANQFTGHDLVFLAGGVVTGPLFGLLGRRWARRHSWWAAAPLVGAFCLEPLAWRYHEGRLPHPTYIWTFEVLAGVGLAALFITSALRRALSSRADGSRVIA